MIWLVLVTAAASELRFHPGPGDHTVVLDDPGRLMGSLLAHVAHPQALTTHPDVASVHVLPGTGHVVRVVPRPGVSELDLANLLHGEDGVRWAHPDLRLDLVPHAVPDDPLLSEQWHLINTGQRGYVVGVDIHAEEAWDITTGAGMLIAVVDSGVDVDHPDLNVIDGTDFVDGDASSDPDDDHAHGTAVAGLVAAIGDNSIGTTGVAYGAQVYGLRLLGGGGSSLSATYEAFVEAVDHGAHVINNSWGVLGGCNGFEIVGALQDAFDYAEEVGRDGLGTVNVFSAGNDACDVTNDGILAYPPVIGVAAVDGFDRRESYSSFGPWVDLAAPSGFIVTTDLVGPQGGSTNVDGDLDYTDAFGGTSASAPQVAGVAALMIAANPRITAAEVRRVLCETSVRVDPTGGGWDDAGWSPLYGCGRVDAGAAVRAVVNQGPPAPPDVAAQAEAPPERVLLRWAEADDPDGDTVRYRVRWARSVAPDDEAVVLVDQPWLDLTGQVTEGDVVQWRVRGLDPWGSGEWSAVQSLTVSTPPVPEVVVPASGCGHATRPPAPWPSGASGVVLAALLLVRRQRV